MLLDAFSSREPVFTSLENAIVPHNSCHQCPGGFMTIAPLAGFQFALLLAAALMAVLLPTASEAYTQEQQQACSDDAFRLCGPAIPDVDRVTACMVSKKEQLSPGCRVFFRDEPEANAGAPVDIKPRSAKPHKARKPHRSGAT